MSERSLLQWYICFEFSDDRTGRTQHPHEFPSHEHITNLLQHHQQ